MRYNSLRGIEMRCEEEYEAEERADNMREMNEESK